MEAASSVAFVSPVAQDLATALKQAGVDFFSSEVGWTVMPTSSGLAWCENTGIISGNVVTVKDQSNYVTVFISPLRSAHTILMISFDRKRGCLTSFLDVGDSASMLEDATVIQILRVCDAVLNGVVVRYAQEQMDMASVPTPTSFLSALASKMATSS